MPNIIAYRGDSRDYQIVFNNGFKPRDSSQPKYREDGMPNPDSLVCITHKVEVAGIFPTIRGENRQDSTWIYVVNINTDQNEYAEFIPNDEMHIAAMGYRYGDEANLKKIEPKEIVAAIKCERYFFQENDSYLNGGMYKLTGYIENPNCNLSKHEQVSMHLHFLQQMNQWRPLPVPGDGLVTLDPDILLSYCSKSIENASFFSNMLAHRIKYLEKANEFIRVIEGSGNLGSIESTSVKPTNTVDITAPTQDNPSLRVVDIITGISEQKPCNMPTVGRFFSEATREVYSSFKDANHMVTLSTVSQNQDEMNKQIFKIKDNFPGLFFYTMRDNKRNYLIIPGINLPENTDVITKGLTQLGVLKPK